MQNYGLNNRGTISSFLHRKKCTRSLLNKQRGIFFIAFMPKLPGNCRYLLLLWHNLTAAPNELLNCLNCVREYINAMCIALREYIYYIPMTSCGKLASRHANNFNRQIRQDGLTREGRMTVARVTLVHRHIYSSNLAQIPKILAQKLGSINRFFKQRCVQSPKINETFSRL